MTLISLKNIRISGLSVFLGLIILSYGNVSAVTYLSQFGSSGSGNGQFSNPVGIALDLSRNIYVVDNFNYRIQVFSDNVNCLPPISGDWTITSICVLQSSATAPANVIVQNGAILSIPVGKTLDINFGANYLLVEQVEAWW